MWHFYIVTRGKQILPFRMFLFYWTENNMCYHMYVLPDSLNNEKNCEISTDSELLGNKGSLFSILFFHDINTFHCWHLSYYWWYNITNCRVHLYLYYFIKMSRHQVGAKQVSTSLLCLTTMQTDSRMLILPLHTVLTLNKSTTCHVIAVQLSGCLITGNQLCFEIERL